MGIHSSQSTYNHNPLGRCIGKPELLSSTVACVVQAHTRPVGLSVSQQYERDYSTTAGTTAISSGRSHRDLNCGLQSRYALSRHSPARSSDKLDNLDENRNNSRPNHGYLNNEKTRCSRPRRENEGGILQEANLMPRQRSNALSFIMRVDSPYQDPGVIRRMQNFKFAEQDQRVCPH